MKLSFSLLALALTRSLFIEVACVAITVEKSTLVRSEYGQKAAEVLSSGEMRSRLQPQALNDLSPMASTLNDLSPMAAGTVGAEATEEEAEESTTTISTKTFDLIGEMSVQIYPGDWNFANSSAAEAAVCKGALLAAGLDETEFCKVQRYQQTTNREARFEYNITIKLVEYGKRTYLIENAAATDVGNAVKAAITTTNPPSEVLVTKLMCTEQHMAHYFGVTGHLIISFAEVDQDFFVLMGNQSVQNDIRHEVAAIISDDAQVQNTVKMVFAQVDCTVDTHMTQSCMKATFFVHSAKAWDVHDKLLAELGGEGTDEQKAGKAAFLDRLHDHFNAPSDNNPFCGAAGIDESPCGINKVRHLDAKRITAVQAASLPTPTDEWTSTTAQDGAEGSDKIEGVITINTTHYGDITTNIDRTMATEAIELALSFFAHVSKAEFTVDLEVPGMVQVGSESESDADDTPHSDDATTPQLLLAKQSSSHELASQEHTHTVEATWTATVASAYASTVVAKLQMVTIDELKQRILHTMWVDYPATYGPGNVDESGNAVLTKDANDVFDIDNTFFNMLNFTAVDIEHIQKHHSAGFPA